MGSSRSRFPFPPLPSEGAIRFSVAAEHLEYLSVPLKTEGVKSQQSVNPTHLTLSKYYLTLWEPETPTLRESFPLSNIGIVTGLSRDALEDRGTATVANRFGIRIVGIFQGQWRSESYVFQHVSDETIESLIVNMIRYSSVRAVLPPELRRENSEKYEMFESLTEEDGNESKNFQEVPVDEDYINSDFADFVNEMIRDTGTIFIAEPRKMLIVVNPTSGIQNAGELYRDRMMPCLNMIPNFSHDVVFTESAGHGTEIMRRFDFSKYNEVGVVGGDGTVNEVLQGLLSHESVSPMEACNVSIAVFPGGNGNALAHFVGASTVELGCLIVARGRVCRQDVATAFNSDSRMFCFLSLMLGAGADIDLGLECVCCKKLGVVRDMIGGMLALLRMRFIRINTKFISDRLNDVRQMEKVPPPQYHSILEEGHHMVDVSAPYTVPPCPLVKKYLADEFRAVAPSFIDEVLDCGGDQVEGEVPPAEEDGDRDSIIRIEDVEREEEDGNLVVREDNSLRYFLFDLAGIPRLLEDLWHCPRTNGNDGQWVAATMPHPTRNLCRMGASFNVLFNASDGEPLMNSRDYEFNTFRACYVEPVEGSNMGFDGERAPYAPTILEIHQGLLSLFRF